MEQKNIILIFIVILVVALMAVAVYTFTDHGNDVKNVTANLTKNDTKVANTTNVTNTTSADNSTNKTVVGDNSTLNATNNTNKTYKVYNPQSDSYVEVIGEKFDAEVHRWYTYDHDGVRYYNTRIN